MTITALFVAKNSVYKTLPGVDCWDEARDARKWLGGTTVVAHPPCKRWSSLNNLVLCRYPDRAEEFATGNDGGLFEFALRQVRQWGGVLEHPAYSRAWKHFDLPEPARNAWQMGLCGGWCIEVDQGDYGHPARKLTWLYAYGSPPPKLPAPVPRVDDGKRPGTVRPFRRRLDNGEWERPDFSLARREITHSRADATPRQLAEWLVEVARQMERCPA